MSLFPILVGSAARGNGMKDASALGFFVAPLFVVLWSTGFVGAKFGLPYAEPLTFLAIRFALAALVLGLWALLAGEWHKKLKDPRGAVVVGIMIHAIYLGGVFTAIWLGAGAALTALIVGLQPVATAFLSRFMFGERLTARQWLGMSIGLAGVTLVVGRKLDAGLISPAGIALCLLGLIAISFASILQRRRGISRNLAADSSIQFAAATVVVGLGAVFFETGVINWTPEFVGALAWMVFGLSLGAVSLLYVLLQRGAASITASLFFLVPGVTAAMAHVLFGEQFGAAELAGLGAAMIGVRLVTSPAKRPVVTS
jgi:drug/metabolite transporter (DMT)-like permease